jgi:DNA-binding MarR family transcriptional regulator
MQNTARNDNVGDERILLGLLESVERDGAQSQRKLAAELGIALGLVNAYLKRCATKGLLKMSEVPTRRYAYYLTPKGFTEKSRLTVEYLSSSFSFFRLAKADCVRVFEAAKTRGLRKFVLAGKTDLAEIAILCAIETDVRIVAVVDADAAPDKFLGIDVVASYEAVMQAFDAVLVTDFGSARAAYDAAVAAGHAKQVLAPALLGLSLVPSGGEVL